MAAILVQCNVRGLLLGSVLSRCHAEMAVNAFVNAILQESLTVHSGHFGEMYTAIVRDIVCVSRW